MAFLSRSQMKSHIYGSVTTAISKGDDTILKDAIDAAITEAKGYLSLYNTEQIFHNVNEDDNWRPDHILLMYVKNMAKWHFCTLGNANIDLEDAEVRYEQAIKWLSGVQAGKIVPVGFPPAQPEERSTFFHFSSNPKRKNHY